MAQHFGPDRIVKIGMRSPHLPLHVSEEEKLKKGQPFFHRTDHLAAPGTCGVRCVKGVMGMALKDIGTKPGKTKFDKDFPELAAFVNKLQRSTYFAGHYGLLDAASLLLSPRLSTHHCLCDRTTFRAPLHRR